MNSRHAESLHVWTPCVRRTSASDRPTSARNPSRLRLSTLPVLPATPTLPGLEHLEREDRRVHQVPQFMSQKSKPLGSARDFSHRAWTDCSLAPVLRDGARDGVVEAAVQHAKVIGADGRVHFHGELGDGLTDVAVVVHDLRDREPLSQQVMPVLNRAVGDVGIRPETRAQRSHELLQEHGHAVIDLRLGRRRNRPRRDFGPATTDELVAVCGNEFVQHRRHKHARIHVAKLFRKRQVPCLSNLRQRQARSEAA